MFVADQKLVDALLAGVLPPRCGRAAKGAPPSVEVTPGTSGTRRSGCRCGHCPPCLDNARWERIFTEKFLDPHYYLRQAPTFGSSLNSW
jgi:hypothetical protein